MRLQKNPLGELNVVLTRKNAGAETYVFMFPDDKVKEVLMTFGRFACNPELSFTWQDAAVCSFRVREMVYGESPCQEV